MDAGGIDEVVRIGLWALLGGGALLGLLGGFVRRVEGEWLDGTARIALVQRACVVWGEGRVEGGQQRFWGVGAFGVIWLRRTDRGALHLSQLGFARQQWPALEGRVLATLVLRLAGDELVGSFWGRRFRFSGARLVATSAAAPVPRRWQRAPTAS